MLIDSKIGLAQFKNHSTAQFRVVQQIKTYLKFTDQIRYFDELEKKIKIKFTGISDLDLSFQLTMI